MASRTVIELIDDLDNSPAAETVTFTFRPVHSSATVSTSSSPSSAHAIPGATAS